MNRKPPKGLKWLAEGLHYTWGLTRDGAHSQVLPGGQAEFQYAWCQARHQVQFLAAAMLGLTWPRKVGTLVLFLGVRQNP